MVSASSKIPIKYSGKPPSRVMPSRRFEVWGRTAGRADVASTFPWSSIKVVCTFIMAVVNKKATTIGIGW